MDLSLSRMDAALEALQLTAPPFPIIQIVGTNGKGSTSTFLESLARAHGLRTGLFTSPHFVSPRERICIEGSPIPEDLWPALAQKVHTAAPTLTYFEFLTVLAVLAFHEAQIDVAIIEAGLGGHYDATTALQRSALCITPISMDHERVLGSTLQAIAADKAEAIAQHMPVFLGEQEPHIKDFLHDFSKKRGAHIHPVHTNLLPEALPLGLHGTHQKHNAALALNAWHWLSQEHAWPYTEQNIRYGLSNAFIAGRLQTLSPNEQELPSNLLLDGAHNAQGLQALIAHVQSLTTKPAAIIFSCLADKDTQSMLPLLKELHEECQHCPLHIVDIQNNERALNHSEKIALAQEIGHASAVAGELHHTLTHVKEHASRTPDAAPILLCGSLYLLGEFYAKYPQYLFNTPR